MKLQQQISPNKNKSAQHRIILVLLLLLLLFLNPNFNPSPAAYPVAHLGTYRLPFERERERERTERNGSLEWQLRQLGYSVLKQIGSLSSPRPPIHCPQPPISSFPPIEADRLPSVSTVTDPWPLIGSLPSWISFLDRLAPGEWRPECSTPGPEPEDWYFSLSPFLSLTLSFNFEVLALVEYLFCLMC